MDDFRPRPQRPLSVPKRPLNGPVPAPPTQGAPVQTSPQPQIQQNTLIDAQKSSPAPESTSVDTNAPTGLALGTKKKSRKWLWVAIPVAVIGLLIAMGIAAWGWYSDALKPKTNDETPVTLEVQSGASIEQVAEELEQKGVIKSSLAFSIYMKLGDKNVIKTGNYLFAPNQSVEEIVTWLNEGRVSTRRVTILPGQTLKQIKGTLVKDGYTQEAVDAAFAKTYNHPVLEGKPASATLEGYIYPETYFVTLNSSPEELITRSLDEFQKAIQNNGLKEKLSARGFNLYEGITLASIIAKEVTNPDDQKQVSQVFQTRLERGINLGSDVTYHYAADMLGVERAVNIDSPYNTRIHTGLPPGPIGNFNLPALVAVATPAQGDYLFFVAGDDGVTYYSKTLQEHEENIRNHCQKLCSQA
jgi:UPF0755 protein